MRSRARTLGISRRSRPHLHKHVLHCDAPLEQDRTASAVVDRTAQSREYVMDLVVVASCEGGMSIHPEVSLQST